MAQYIVRIATQEYVHYWRTGRPVGGAPTAHRADATRYDRRTANQIAEDLRWSAGYPTDQRVTVVKS